MEKMQKTIKDCLRYFCMMTAMMYWPIKLETVPRRRYLGDDGDDNESNFAVAFDAKEQQSDSPEGV